MSLLSLALYYSLFFLKKEILPDLFFLIPLFFAFASGLLAWLIDKNEKNAKFLTMPVILAFRAIVVVTGLIFLVIGLFLDRSHLISFAVLFAVYYIAFSIVETKRLININK